jgi:flavin reductase (DIM6/NTAB) family NADH-FMN oxidoreductase RutF
MDGLIEHPASADLRAVMSRFATGVTVMTTRGGPEPHAMTANAVASVSLDPLLVLVCVERTTEMVRHVEAAGCFALSILRADQAAVSDHFADPARPSGRAQFDPVATSVAVTGAPVIDGALGWIDCSIWAIHDGGDHEIVVGEIQAIALGDAAAALGYFRSGYVTIEAP